MNISSEMSIFGRGSFHYILEAIHIRSPDPDPDSGSMLRIRTVFALAICSLQLLLFQNWLFYCIWYFVSVFVCVHLCVLMHVLVPVRIRSTWAPMVRCSRCRFLPTRWLGQAYHVTPANSVCWTTERSSAPSPSATQVDMSTLVARCSCRCALFQFLLGHYVFC